MSLTPDLETFNLILLGWGALGIVSAGGMLLGGMMPMSGREQRRELNLLGTIDKKLGWMVMEIPILIVVAWAFLTLGTPTLVSGVIVGAFFGHYVYRALIFPHRIRASGKRMPVMIMLFSMIFYLVNGAMIGYYFGVLKTYPVEWLWDPRFVIGALMFVGGFLVNVQSDNILIALRKPGETGYRIPRGGCYRWVSCPNYMGECLEWIGFAVMSWSLMGAVYALWVVLPLIAQALPAHRWYLEKFGDDYPRERRAIIPFLL